MKGTHAEARAFNGFLDAIRNKVHAAEREMIQDGKVITYQSFKDKWFGVHEKPFMLMEIFKQHNEQIKILDIKVSEDMKALKSRLLLCWLPSCILQF